MKTYQGSLTGAQIDALPGKVTALENDVKKHVDQSKIFPTVSAISITSPQTGQWVLIGNSSSEPYEIYRYNGTAWVDTGKTYTIGSVTTADQINDTSLNKNQQAINAELMAVKLTTMTLTEWNALTSEEQEASGFVGILENDEET